jgi:hypothetical protein
LASDESNGADNGNYLANAVAENKGNDDAKMEQQNGTTHSPTPTKQ